MNPATGAKIPSAETVEKLENLAVYTEKRIEQLKSEVVEMQKALEEHKLFASNVLSNKQKELLAENQKLRNEIEEWKKKVFAMEGKLGGVETKVGDSIAQNKTFLDKLNEQNKKLNLQGDLLNKQNEKLTAQDGKLGAVETKVGDSIAQNKTFLDKLNEQNEKLTAQEGILNKHEEKLLKQQEVFSHLKKKITSGTVEEEMVKEEEAVSVHVGRLDIRVGKILSIKKHPDADTLYVEQIDVGEEKPRNVVSGLVKFIPIKELENRMVVVVCNMKPSKMRGVLSEAMVLCASDPNKVEVLNPPKGALPGERVFVEGYSSHSDSLLSVKKKIFETVAVDLKTDLTKTATYKGKPFYIPNKGPITSTTLTDANIK